MMKKRFLYVIVAAMLVLGAFGLAGCSGGTDQSSSTSAASESAASSDTSAAAESAASSDTSAAAESTEASGKKVLREASTAYGIDTTDDPVVGGWNYWHLMYNGMGETLFKVGDDGSMQPWLAESATKTGPKTFEIKINDAAMFSDGNPVTAEAVMNCLARTEDAEGGLARGTLDIADMSADGQVLTITTATDMAYIESYLANGIFVIYEMPEGDSFDELVFTGPFIKGAYEPSVSLTLEANPNYWNGTPKLDEIQLIAYDDQTAGIMALQNGEVDFVREIPAAMIADFESNPDLQVFTAASDRGEQLWFNEEHPVASDPAVKRALAMCFDRDAIAENFYYGISEPNYGIWGSQFSFGGTEGLDIPVTGMDLDGAKQVLEEAGWVDGDGDGIREKDGETCKLTIVAYPYDVILSTLDDVTNKAKEVGIEIESIVTQDYPSYEASGEFDMIWTSESTALVGTPYYYVNNFLVTGGSGNSGKYSSETVDALATELMEAEDQAEIDRICGEITEQVMNDGHVIIYGTKNIVRGGSSKVIYTPSSCDYYTFDCDTDIAE